MVILSSINEWRDFERDLQKAALAAKIWRNLRPDAPNAPRVPWTEEPVPVNAEDFPVASYFVADGYPIPDLHPRGAVPTADRGRPQTLAPIDPNSGLPVLNAYQAQIRTDNAYLYRQRHIDAATAEYTRQVARFDTEITGVQEMEKWYAENLSPALLSICRDSEALNPGLHTWLDTLRHQLKVCPAELKKADLVNYEAAMAKMAKLPEPGTHSAWLISWKSAMNSARINGVHAASVAEEWVQTLISHTSTSLPEWTTNQVRNFDKEIYSNTLDFDDIVSSITWAIESSNRHQGRDAVFHSANNNAKRPASNHQRNDDRDYKRGKYQENENESDNQDDHPDYDSADNSDYSSRSGSHSEDYRNHSPDPDHNRCDACGAPNHRIQGCAYLRKDIRSGMKWWTARDHKRREICDRLCDSTSYLARKVASLVDKGLLPITYNPEYDHDPNRDWYRGDTVDPADVVPHT